MDDPTFITARRERLASARLYLLATEAVGGTDWLGAVERALHGGVDVVQLREKSLDDAAFAERARRLASLCHAHRALFVVNDRVEIAREVRADGVHVGQDDASVAAARALLGPDALVGVSTHDSEELDRALADGADYVGMGSVFPTTTKGRAVPVGSPSALAPLAQRAEDAGVPAFAIGGIDVAQADAVAAAGFTRIATCAGVLGADDPESAARALRAALTRRA
jgi:thiamine-phosphate pyrophosphorylase